MYIHLGSDYMVSIKEVITIINIDPPVSNSIKEIIELAGIDKKLCYIGEKGKEKSLVLTDDYAYLSPISSITLFKRACKFDKEV